MSRWTPALRAFAAASGQTRVLLAHPAGGWALVAVGGATTTGHSPWIEVAGFAPDAMVGPWRGLPYRLRIRPRRWILWRDGRPIAGTGIPAPPHAHVAAPGAPLPLPTVTDPDAWRARSQRALAAIAAGQLRKVVLARVAELGPAAPVELLVSRALACEHRALVYAVEHAGRCLVGATPEPLLAGNPRRVAIRAIASTAPREAAARLLLDPKLRHEQRLVTTEIAQRLAPYAHRVRGLHAPRLLHTATLAHLENRIVAELTSATGPDRLAALLHPTAAIAGFPRRAALAWLAEHEPLPRGWYGGRVGWFDGQRGRWWVMLRCVLLLGGCAWGYVGAGIVAGSDPAAEWEETERKLGAIARWAM